MIPNNPYQTLGVDPAADGEEIKQAYRRLAVQYHPGDRRAEEKFKEINGAYETLRDPEKRADFDRRGFRSSRSQPAGPSPFGSRPEFSEIFEHLFADLYQRPGTRSDLRTERGKDLKFHATITLEEVVTGVKRPIQIHRLETCDPCRGDGTSGGGRSRTCVVCGGAGHVRSRYGLLTLGAPCRACGGAGEVVQDICKHCGGTGRIQRQRTLSIRIPPGAEEGMRLTIRGEGNAGIRGGRPGNLIVTIGIRPHLFFRREGMDVHCPLAVAMVEAAMGTDLKVPTLDGSTLMKLPSGTQSGSTFRLRGKGLPKPGGGTRGDQLVHVRVETPTRMSRRQRELLKRFGKAGAHPENSPDDSKRAQGLPLSARPLKLKGRLRRLLRRER